MHRERPEPGLRAGHLEDGRRLQRRRDGAGGPVGAGGAVRRGRPAQGRARPGPERGHRHRDRRRPAGRVLPGRGPLPGRRPAGRHHRRARPDPHELPPGAGGRGGGQQPPRGPVSRADASLQACSAGRRPDDVDAKVHMADYYELLRCPPRRLGRTTSSAPTGGWPASTTPTATPTPAARERMAEINRAYEVLSDPERRARYDRFGAEDERGQRVRPAAPSAPAAASATCSTRSSAALGLRRPRPAARRGPPRGVDLEATVDLEFADAVFGTADRGRACAPRWPAPTATPPAPPPGTAPTTCPDCGGTGQVRRVRQSILGQMVTSGPCSRCGGLGQVIEQRCPTCNGDGRTIDSRTYTVDVPAGVDSGTTLRLAGRGAVGPRGGAAGDLYVHVRVRPHERLRPRRRRPRTSGSTISVAQAALGATLPLRDARRHRGADRSRRAPRAARCSGCGARACPSCRAAGRGDLLVELVVATPDRPLPGGGGAAAALRRAPGRGRGRGRHRLPGPHQARVPLMAGPTPPPSIAGPPLVFVDDVDAPGRSTTATATTSSGSSGCGAGQPITVSDGNGSWRDCAFGPVIVPLGDRFRPSRARCPTLTVAFAIPKGDRAGVGRAEADGGRRRPHRRCCTRTARSCAGTRHARRAISSGCDRVAREAAMQSRRCWLPAGVGTAGGRRRGWHRAARPAASRGGRPRRSTIRCCSSARRADGPMANGPTVGRTVALGPHVLRVETAALCAGAASRRAP